MLDPYQELNLDPSRATDETVRSAYMQALRSHPPDRDPVGFERIQRAYDQLKDEQRRRQLNLFGVASHQSIAELLPTSAERPRAGIERWLAVIDAEAKRKPSK